ncbi:MAG: hypothetical protein PHN37_01585 [Candidatus Pacebacteria bacterium]|nr:hypothetical protein [Candidatus Paceibacterota bacterium]
MQKDFTKNFIKGKIGEIIFDQMFKEEGSFIVIPFGYERMIPELAQYASEADYQEVIDNIRSAPDFALVSQNRKEVFLIEVKYRSRVNIEELKKTANKIQKRWKLIWMFICTPSGFYFNKTTDLIKNEKLTPLGENWICQEEQEKYLKLLNNFIKN